VFFGPVDGILFQEHPFSSSSNNHLTWQRSFPFVPVPHHRNVLMEALPMFVAHATKKSGCENKECIFSDILHSSCSYESTRSCTSSLKFAALKFLRKPFENFSKDFHAAFSLSLNTASNCWSLKSCLI